jgi:hypothetical protein
LPPLALVQGITDINTTPAVHELPPRLIFLSLSLSLSLSQRLVFLCLRWLPTDAFTCFSFSLLPLFAIADCRGRASVTLPWFASLVVGGRFTQLQCLLTNATATRVAWEKKEFVALVLSLTRNNDIDFRTDYLLFLTDYVNTIAAYLRHFALVYNIASPLFVCSFFYFFHPLSFVSFPIRFTSFCCRVRACAGVRAVTAKTLKKRK